MEARRQSTTSHHPNQQPAIINKTPTMSQSDGATVGATGADGDADASSNPRPITAEETELLLIDQTSTPAAERSLS